MKNFFKNEKLANKRKLIFGILASIVLILGLGIIYLNHFTNSGLPQITGTLTLEGLAYQVTVTRDEHGTTHIEAESDKDLFLAQGFIHAQDRLFQMDLARRQASGRLAEVFGEIAINQDRYFRTLLLRYYAEKSLPVHSEETINIINWYVQGINAFIEKAISNNNLPVEFGVLRYTPEPWTVYDTLTLVNLKAYDLAGHWEGQAFRAYLIQNFSEEKALELFPINTSRTSAGPFVLTDEQLQIQGLFSNILDYLPNEFNGSNNWVISGDRTATGFPMLADDPHLSLATPSIWYHNHLKGGNFNVNGVSVAGTPGVVLGHNPYISWGVTNTGPDVQDLFIELRNPENPHQFLFEDEWEEATVLSERIYVDGGEPIDFEIIITRNGPIVSTLANYENRETELSLRWTAHSKTAELDAVLGFNRATNWEEFEEAARDLPSPTQNFVFASNDGTIAFRTIGKVPIRANGRIPDLPAPGWSSEYSWVGYIPFEEMPNILNPETGFIATANYRVVSENYMHFITDQWAQPFRQIRINDLLEANENVTVADMKAYQTDNKNLEGYIFLPQMLDTLAGGFSQSPHSSTAITHLQNWNFFDEIDSIGSTIFNIWMREIGIYLFNETISEDMLPLFRRRSYFVNTLLERSFNGEHVYWIENRGGLTHVLQASFENTIANIENRLGSNINNWAWGNFHQVEFRHPLSSVWPLNMLFNPRGRIATPGSGVTLNQQAFTENGLTNHGAGWRFIIEMNGLNNSYQIVVPGNSGHPRSPFYHNNIDTWINNEFRQTSITVPSGHILTLMPN